MGQHLVLRHHGGGGVLHDHKAGVDAGLGGEEGGQAVGQGGVDHPLGAALGGVGNLRAGDAQSVEGDGHGLAVEVAAGDDRLVLQEDQGVVGDGVELDLHLIPDIVQGVPDGAVKLGDAPQGVGVLHPVLLAVVQNFGALQQLAHVLGHQHLALLAADLMDAGVKGVAQAGEALEVHRADDVAQLGGADGVIQGQGAHGGHGAGAVGHAQALFAHQGVQGVDTRLGHGVGAGHELALVVGLSLAQHGQGHVGQGGQVAGGAQGALLGDPGVDALVEHLNHHLHQQGAHAGHAAAQGVGPQQQHAAHHFLGVGLAGAGAVAENQVGGQLVAHLLGDGHLLEVTEAGGDAVGHAALLGDLLGQGAGLLHGLQGGAGQLHRGAVPGDGHKALQVQAMAVQDDVLDGGRIHNHGELPHFIYFSADADC